MRIIYLALITLALSHNIATAATLSIEGYSYSVLNGDLKTIGHSIDLYANGEKVIADSKCTNENPCKVVLNKKATLTLCNSSTTNLCQTGIRFDPTDSPVQRFAFVLSPSAYSAIPYIVYRPEEMSVIDGFLAKQVDAEKRAEERKQNRQY
jgi:hypothetical protein